MKSFDILLNSLFSLFVGITAGIIIDLFEEETPVIILIAFFIISIIWLMSYVKEINKRSRNNLFKIKDLGKYLNISERLIKLEEWRAKCEKGEK